MKEYKIPYYKSYLPFQIDEKLVKRVLESKAEEYQSNLHEEEIVIEALKNPINSLNLSELSISKKHIVIISSDHTRPVPSHITMPLILKEIRKYNNDVKITILIATGMHRETKKEELIAKFGSEIVENENIVIHNAYNDDDMAFLGILPSKGKLFVNKLVTECDLLISEGFIEPHFFAGFSGGRKSVLPGISSKDTVLWNHNAKFIASVNARCGVLENNPIHEDMLFAAKKANLRFILNVVINSEKKIIKAFAGDLEKAHEEGTKFVSSLAKIENVNADIVITSNGGYPLDQNIYQTVKGMTAAEKVVNKGGVIIIASSCVDGTGGDYFYKLLANEKNAKDCYEKLCLRKESETEFDQWEAQILARILCKATVIIVSDKCEASLITSMHMLHSTSINEAYEMAKQITKKEEVVIIKDGVSVII